MKQFLRKVVDSGWVWVLVGLLVLVAACRPAQAQATGTGSITLTWTAPTQNTDGTPIPATGLAALQLYQVEYALCPTIATVNFTNAQAPTVAAPALTMTISGLAAGQWCFHVRAENNGAEISDYSNVVAATPIQPTPSPPSGVTPTNQTSAAQTAYYLVQQPHTPVMIAVGNVPAGTTCDTTTVLLVGGTNYYVVPETALQPYGNVKPQLVWAKCT